MTHPSEEQLVDAYYSGPGSDLRLHLDTCSECAALYRSISETLDSASESPIATRGDHYGSEVWDRLLPHLPPSTSRRPMRLLVPALAALLAIAFLTARFAKHTPVQQPPILAAKKLPAAPQILTPQAPSPMRHRVTAKADLRVKSLAGSKSPEARKELTGLYTSSDQTLKHEILNSILSTGDANTAVILIKEEKDPGLRVSAVKSLAALPGRGSLFTTLYQDEPNDEVRKALLNALVSQQNTKALLDLAHHETDVTRKSEILNHLYKIQNTSTPKPRFTSDWR